MRPMEFFISQPIRSLQTMLRVIAENDADQPSVIPDGFYGKDTVYAVSAFQRKTGLPITGITDQQTWEAIVAAYDPALVQIVEAQPVDIILNPGQVIRKGERNPNVYLAQAILIVLNDAYSSIPAPAVTGILDIPTSEALSIFQRMSLLPETGELDKHTWKHLALHYPMAANLLIPGSGIRPGHSYPPD